MWTPPPFEPTGGREVWQIDASVGELSWVVNHDVPARTAGSLGGELAYAGCPAVAAARMAKHVRQFRVFPSCTPFHNPYNLQPRGHRPFAGQHRHPADEGTSTTTMKNRIVRVPAEVGIPVTIRRVSGGLLFWRSTDEDLRRGAEAPGRLQSARQPPHTTSWDLTERMAYLCGIGRQRWNPLLSKCCDGMS
jgi:hypothetical protein